MNHEDNGGLLNLSFPQKLQLGALGTGTLLFLITYIISILLNGTQYTNQWILTNPVPVLAYWAIQIGLIPYYRKADPTHLKYVKQAAVNFFWTGGAFILIWIYYQFHPPQTGIDRVVEGLSQILTFIAVGGILISGSIYKLKNNQ